MASTGITVTPELLRTTASKIDTDLEHAIAVANSYLSGHENVVSATLFTGDAATASLTTAGHLNDSLQQTISGCQRLSHGLRQAATLMEQHEHDAAHSFSGLFGDTPTSV
ncbi:MAG TPA: WXG100 family type VII secretion target [Mycobacterium sp.]